MLNLWVFPKSGILCYPGHLKHCSHFVSICFFSFIWIKSFLPRSADCRVMKCRMGGGGGGLNMVLGVVDVARVNPNQSIQGAPYPTPLRSATGSHPTGQRRSPTSGVRLEVRLTPGRRRPPVPDYIGRRRMGDESLKGIGSFLLSIHHPFK